MERDADRQPPPRYGGDADTLEQRRLVIDGYLREVDIPTQIEYTQQFDPSKLHDDIDDPARATPAQLNTYALEKLAWYTSNKLRGVGLLCNYQQVFRGWGEATFRKIHELIARNLQNTLRSRGIYAGPVWRQSAYDLALLVTATKYPEWPDEDCWGPFQRLQAAIQAAPTGPTPTQFRRPSHDPSNIPEWLAGVLDCPDTELQEEQSRQDIVLQEEQSRQTQGVDVGPNARSDLQLEASSNDGQYDQPDWCRHMTRGQDHARSKTKAPNTNLKDLALMDPKELNQKLENARHLLAETQGWNRALGDPGVETGSAPPSQEESAGTGLEGTECDADSDPEMMDLIIERIVRNFLNLDGEHGLGCEE